jgi:formiminotetrahydrofolate cyclodeaminase
VFADSRISDFLEAVAAKTPTPGGGSVSAVVGALGAALGVMTARFSESAEAEQALDALKKELLALADADAEAYGMVNTAMSLPKDSDETKRRRKAALQNALGEASEVPLRGMTLGVKGLEALAGLAPNCNRHLTSDLVGAAGFLAAAVTGCAENVRINAAALKDRERGERLEKERLHLLAEAESLRGRIAREVETLYAAK